MSNEGDRGIRPNLTLFFRCFLNTLAEMNGMFLKRRHFDPGTGQWKGRNPQRPESWTTEGA
ncbi:MAG: hypothetical protein WAL98_20630 [Desulfatiglandaceae bacterium]